MRKSSAFSQQTLLLSELSSLFHTLLTFIVIHLLLTPHSMPFSPTRCSSFNTPSSTLPSGSLSLLSPSPTPCSSTNGTHVTSKNAHMTREVQPDTWTFGISMFVCINAMVAGWASDTYAVYFIFYLLNQ